MKVREALRRVDRVFDAACWAILVEPLMIVVEGLRSVAMIIACTWVAVVLMWLWLNGLGFFCASVELEEGRTLTLHGLSCRCDDAGGGPADGEA